MNRPPRFARTTAGLDLNALLSPLRKVFLAVAGNRRAAERDFSLAQPLPAAGGKSTPAERDATRILQFAVNTVIYVLTQEGSMTQRLMQIVH